MNIIRPQKINTGDTIGIIAPAGVIRDNSLWDNAINYFKNKGYKIKIASHCKDSNNYLAGNDVDRLNDLHEFFLDDEIKAIICARGGYGCLRLLENIDYALIKNNPKIFVGFSDITALHCAFNKFANLSTFHGPLFLSDFGTNEINNYTEKNLFNTLKKPYNNKLDNPYAYLCIKTGETTNELIGGNLAVITSLLGTKYFPDLTDKILFLEDLAEPLYKIDRMLTQLKVSGNLDKLSGLLFGEFIKMEESKDEILNLLTERTKDLEIPIGFGFPCGHNSTKATLALGVKYYFNSKDFELRIIQN